MEEPVATKNMEDPQLNSRVHAAEQVLGPVSKLIKLLDDAYKTGYNVCYFSVAYVVNQPRSSLSFRMEIQDCQTQAGYRPYNPTKTKRIQEYKEHRRVQELEVWQKSERVRAEERKKARDNRFKKAYGNLTEEQVRVLFPHGIPPYYGPKKENP